jgi:hypothetical protein
MVGKPQLPFDIYLWITGERIQLPPRLQGRFCTRCGILQSTIRRATLLQWMPGLFLLYWDFYDISIVPLDFLWFNLFLALPVDLMQLHGSGLARTQFNTMM